MFVHVSRCLIYKVHSAIFAVAHSLASLFIISQNFELVKNFFRSFLNRSISLWHALRRKLTDYITLICVCQELFSNSFELFKSIFKTRRSLECRCYYTSFSTKVNIKFAVFFHKDHGVPFVRFCHPSTSCVYNHNHRPCRWFALAPLGHDPGWAYRLVEKSANRAVLPGCP